MFRSWIGAVMLLAQAAGTANSIVLFDGKTFDHWRAERGSTAPKESVLPVQGAPPDIVDGAMRIIQLPGWIRTKTSYADFRLSFSYRRDASSYAGLYFRTWARLDDTGGPTNGYELSLGEGPEPRQTGRVIARGRSGRDRFDPDISRALAAAPGTWHHVVLECRGDTATITIDDRLVSELVGIENPAGYIGLRSEHGAVDIRDIVLTPIQPKLPDRLEGERPGRGSSVTLPQVMSDVKPAYTAEAMRELIAGAVWLGAVVRENGTVGDIEVLRSLDPHFGLDTQAITALRQWRFKPGTRNGKPVPVVVTVELTFTLK